MDEKIKTWTLRFPAKKPQYGEGIVQLANSVAVSAVWCQSAVSIDF